MGSKCSHNLCSKETIQSDEILITNSMIKKDDSQLNSFI